MSGMHVCAWKSYQSVHSCVSDRHGEIEGGGWLLIYDICQFCHLCAVQMCRVGFHSTDSGMQTGCACVRHTSSHLFLNFPLPSHACVFVTWFSGMPGTQPSFFSSVCNPLPLSFIFTSIPSEVWEEMNFKYLHPSVYLVKRFGLP